jgi:hypothetical protein
LRAGHRVAGQEGKLFFPVDPFGAAARSGPEGGADFPSGSSHEMTYALAWGDNDL